MIDLLKQTNDIFNERINDLHKTKKDRDYKINRLVEAYHMELMDMSDEEVDFDYNDKFGGEA